MILWISRRAQQDLAEARRWYRKQAQGLDLEFQRAVEAGLATLERTPEAYPICHRKIRRAVLRRFPYGLFYVVDGERVVVHAVFHLARDPGAVFHRRIGRPQV